MLEAKSGHRLVSWEFFHTRWMAMSKQRVAAKVKGMGCRRNPRSKACLGSSQAWPANIHSPPRSHNRALGPHDNGQPTFPAASSCGPIPHARQPRATQAPVSHRTHTRVRAGDISGTSAARPNSGFWMSDSFCMNDRFSTGAGRLAYAETRPRAGRSAS